MNKLYNEKSPYLLQHAENPVNWYPWCEEAFRKAEEEDKPIFLSIGYSTCHWCHVMAHESFEDPQVADLLNRDFISIKVDREERPDIDAVYMSVCQVMTGSGGWPLTILMTPQQKPFFAGTYLSKTGAYGRMGLIDLLEQAASLWADNRKALLDTGNEITAVINQKSSKHSGHGSEPDRSLIEQAAFQLSHHFDKTWGGFGRAPKFPTPHNLLFLMRYGAVSQDSDLMYMAFATLEAMALGGIHDHIGGGFSRYSTDEKWLVPHFEKMLYDNALLLMAYVKAYQYTNDTFFADIAHRTARYILRELTSNEGGCYCGQDADSDGVEGKYYVFTPEEIVQVLGKTDGEEFCRLYDITKHGNFEGKSIPNQLQTSGDGWTRDDPRRKQLYDYRLRRTQLHKDDKLLLSWNSWTIIALAQAGLALDEPAYLEAAIRIHQFIEHHMTSADDQLYVRWRNGEAAHTGQLDDYAVYALSLLELYQTTLDVQYLEKAIHRAKQLDDRFADQKDSGYFMTSSDSEILISRPKETYDGAIPSGNSVVGMVLQKLAYLTGETHWQDAAQRQLQFLADANRNYPAGGCFAMLAMMDALYPHTELVCISKENVPAELTKYLQDHPADHLSILMKTTKNAERMGRCAPFTEHYPIPEQETMYYLCENGMCQAPVQEFSMLDLA